MRKQYHFRPSGKGFFAWDIARLISLSKNLKTISCKLDTIKEIDENYWYNDAGSIPTTRSIADHVILVNKCNLKYPIILSDDGRVMDGMHRVLKALLKGNKYINAKVFSQTPSPDYVNVFPKDLPY